VSPIRHLKTAHPGRRRAGRPAGATKVRVRRPAADRAERQQVVSSKARCNTVKALVLTDATSGCCSADKLAPAPSTTGPKCASPTRSSSRPSLQASPC
jgi:hypothetical protein